MDSKAEIRAWGGDKMQAAGAGLVEHYKKMAFMGFWEVITNLRTILRYIKKCKKDLLEWQPDVLVLVDYPGFNLRIAEFAKKNDIKTIYYISPQVWAWHRSRAGKLAAIADRLAVILPFEEQLFREYDADVRFVGHPLAFRSEPVPDRDAFCAALGLDPARRILAVFPGSRAQEIERHLEPFLEAARRVVEARWHLQPVVARSPNVPAEAYAGVPFPVTTQARPLLAHAHVALVKSGTTTLETALAGVPMVIAYRTSPLTWWLARRLVKVEHVGLANLVAGRRIAPELLQDDATPAALAAAILPLVDEGPARAAALEGAREVQAALRPDGVGSAAERVAELAAELLER
mgnify:CR=1 FL=1